MNGRYIKGLDYTTSVSCELYYIIAHTACASSTLFEIGGHNFGSVNPEFRIIEGRITEVLLYLELHLKQEFCRMPLSPAV